MDEIGINTRVDVDQKAIITLALAIAIAGIIIVLVSAISRATIKTA